MDSCGSTPTTTPAASSSKCPTTAAVSTSTGSCKRQWTKDSLLRIRNSATRRYSISFSRPAFPPPSKSAICRAAASAWTWCAATSPRCESSGALHYAGQRAGLVVDTLVGELQAVIKPMGKLFSHLKGVAGSTILGSGDVALILDVPALVQHAISAETHTASRRRAAEPAVTSNGNHLQGVS